MLPILLALGVITSGVIVDPGTGDINLPAGQIAAAKPTTAAAGSAVGIPTPAFVWTQPFDPSDRRPYAMDWSAILGTEKIASVRSLTMSALGASLGVEVDDGADNAARLPLIDTEGQVLQLWFKVADAFKSNGAFTWPGTKVGIAALIRTDSSPFEEIERTWVLTVAQQ